MNDKTSFGFWCQSKQIAYIQAESEDVRLIELVDTDLPLSIWRNQKQKKDYPVVGDRGAPPYRDSSMHRPMDSIVLARLRPEDKQPICIGYCREKTALYIGDNGNPPLIPLPYGNIRQEEGLHLWHNQPVFVMQELMNGQNREFLMHGERVIDAANSIRSISIGYSGLCYAKQNGSTWTIVIGADSYDLNPGHLFRIESIENLQVEVFDEQGPSWDCLVLVGANRSFLVRNGYNITAGGIGLRLSNLSLINRHVPLFLEEDHRLEGSPRVTVVWSGGQRSPLPWFTFSHYVRRLTIEKNRAVIVVRNASTDKMLVYYGDDRSAEYNQILPNSLQTNNAEISFIARNGRDIFRVTRAI